MYLARARVDSQTHFILRQSYEQDGCMLSRDLFDLGSDPSNFIHYPGGNAYYFDQSLMDAVEAVAPGTGDSALDTLLMPFLRPEIQRVIEGFDRRHRKGPTKQHLAPKWLATDAIHEFDRRRYHYLRFGFSSQRNLHKVPMKHFRPIARKSRDELEHYFNDEERFLNPAELPRYLMVTFQLHMFTPTLNQTETLLQQIDERFIERLCRLNADTVFMAGTPAVDGLHPYLQKYAIRYFDGSLPQAPRLNNSFWEFIGRHRKYNPPPKVQFKIKEAEALLGSPWKDLKAMSRSQLNRRYRKAAIQHHPDQGGDPNAFRRLTQVYQALLGKKKQ